MALTEGEAAIVKELKILQILIQQTMTTTPEAYASKDQEIATERAK